MFTAHNSGSASVAGFEERLWNGYYIHYIVNCQSQRISMLKHFFMFEHCMPAPLIPILKAECLLHLYIWESSKEVQRLAFKYQSNLYGKLSINILVE